MPTFCYRSKNYWNHYRIKSARSPEWDYGKNGIYYVTICTKHGFPFFGAIKEGQMHLSNIGALAQKWWLQIPHMTFGEVRLASFVIMPNHIHGIVILDRAAGEEPTREEAQAVKTNVDSSQPIPHPKSDDPTLRSAFFRQISPKRGSLSHLMRKFKGLVTKEARTQGWLGATTPLWQARFYDRIVRTAKELQRLEQHIQTNPLTWIEDDYHCPNPAWEALSAPVQLGLSLAAPEKPSTSSQSTHKPICLPTKSPIENGQATKPWWWWFWKRQVQSECGLESSFSPFPRKAEPNVSTFKPPE